MARSAAKTLAPRKLPRQARARETQAAILEGAARVFGERGYAATTTNHIAERAGVSIGTLYEYFPNKDAILAVLHAEHLQASRDLLEGLVEQVRAPDGWQCVEVIARRFVEAVTAQHEQDPALHEVLFEQAPLEPPSRAAFDVFQDDLVKLAAGILRDHPDLDIEDPEMAAGIVVHTVEALTHKLVLHPTPGMDRDAYCEAVVRLVVSFVVPSEASSPRARPIARRR